MNCIFCDILTGKLPAHVVLKDEVATAFLDKRPLFPGHCLLVPRKHTETLVDLDVQIIQPLFLKTKVLAAAVESAMNAEGSFVAINNKVSQSVPHLHIHIVPRRKKDGLKGFFWPRTPYRDENHMLEVRDAIRRALS